MAVEGKIDSYIPTKANSYVVRNGTNIYSLMFILHVHSLLSLPATRTAKHSQAK